MTVDELNTSICAALGVDISTKDIEQVSLVMKGGEVPVITVTRLLFPDKQGTSEVLRNIQSFEFPIAKIISNSTNSGI